MSGVDDRYEDDDYDDDAYADDYDEETRDREALRREQLNLDIERTRALGYTANDLKWFFWLVMAAAWLVPLGVFTVLAAAFAAVLVTWIVRAARLTWRYVGESR